MDGKVLEERTIFCGSKKNLSSLIGLSALNQLYLGNKMYNTANGIDACKVIVSDSPNRKSRGNT